MNMLKMLEDAGFSYPENWVEYNYDSLMAFAKAVAQEERDHCAKFVADLVVMRQPASTYAKQIKNKKVYFQVDK